MWCELRSCALYNTFSIGTTCNSKQPTLTKQIFLNNRKKMMLGDGLRADQCWFWRGWVTWSFGCGEGEGRGGEWLGRRASSHRSLCTRATRPSWTSPPPDLDSNHLREATRKVKRLRIRETRLWSLIEFAETVRAGEGEERFSVWIVERVFARAMVDQNQNQEETLICQKCFRRLRLLRLLRPTQRHDRPQSSWNEAINNYYCDGQWGYWNKLDHIQAIADPTFKIRLWCCVVFAMSAGGHFSCAQKLRRRTFMRTQAWIEL